MTKLQEQMNTLNHISEETDPKDLLKEMLRYHKLYHSRFQMEIFITTKAGGNLYGMWKQAMRELHKRQRGMEGLITAKREMDLNIRELEHCILEGVSKDDLEKSITGFQKERYQIELETLYMSEKHLELNYQDTFREFKEFFAQCFSLMNANHKDVIRRRRAARIYDESPMTETEIEYLDKEMWSYQCKSMLAIDYSRGEKPREAVITMLQAGQDDWRTEIYEILADKSGKKQEALVDWYINYQRPEFDLIEPAVTVEILNDGRIVVPALELEK